MYYTTLHFLFLALQHIFHFLFSTLLHYFLLLFFLHHLLFVSGSLTPIFTFCFQHFHTTEFLLKVFFASPTFCFRYFNAFYFWFLTLLHHLLLFLNAFTHFPTIVLCLFYTHHFPHFVSGTSTPTSTFFVLALLHYFFIFDTFSSSSTCSWHFDTTLPLLLIALLTLLQLISIEGVRDFYSIDFVCVVTLLFMIFYMACCVFYYC